jgi:hypothetical protein
MGPRQHVTANTWHAQGLKNGASSEANVPVIRIDMVTVLVSVAICCSQTSIYRITLKLGN